LLVLGAGNWTSDASAAGGAAHRCSATRLSRPPAAALRVTKAGESRGSAAAAILSLWALPGANRCSPFGTRQLDVGMALHFVGRPHRGWAIDPRPLRQFECNIDPKPLRRFESALDRSRRPLNPSLRAEGPSALRPTTQIAPGLGHPQPPSGAGEWGGGGGVTCQRHCFGRARGGGGGRGPAAPAWPGGHAGGCFPVVLFHSRAWAARVCGYKWWVPINGRQRSAPGRRAPQRQTILKL
jgi:hypothetical protein